MATQWALKLLLGSKACRLMAAHPCGPDEAILILLAAEDLSEQKVTEQMLLQRLQAAQRELDRLPPQHPLELDCNLAGLAGLLGLNPVETEVLALMVYRELATGMEDVLRLNDSAGGQNGFAALAARMLDRPLNDVREALSSRGKLLQCGLLAYPDSRREGPFALPFGLADMLMHHTDAPSIILRRYSQHDHPAAHELNDFQHLGSLLETLTRFLQGAMTTSLEGVNILIHGRPGTGKTELARALAEFLFDDEESMVRIDMSEYMERHAVSRLIGAPPGYVGYEEGGQLTEAVRRRPYRVILLDEIEKAHPDVFNILLQILEDGRLTDNAGRIVNFSNTVVIMTSNIGSEYITPAPEAATEGERRDQYEQMREQVTEALRTVFRPELLNRLDEVIVFHSLTSREILEIVDLMLSRVARSLADRRVKLVATEAAKKLLAEEGYDPRYGARPLRRTIQKLVENPISSALLRGEFGEGDTIQVDVEEGEIRLRLLIEE
jgi:MoxR-like ATPase